MYRHVRRTPGSWQRSHCFCIIAESLVLWGSWVDMSLRLGPTSDVWWYEHSLTTTKRVPDLCHRVCNHQRLLINKVRPRRFTQRASSTAFARRGCCCPHLVVSAALLRVSCSLWRLWSSWSRREFASWPSAFSRFAVCLARNCSKPIQQRELVYTLIGVGRYLQDNFTFSECKKEVAELIFYCVTTFLSPCQTNEGVRWAVRMGGEFVGVNQFGEKNVFVDALTTHTHTQNSWALVYLCVCFITYVARAQRRFVLVRLHT